MFYKAVVQAVLLYGSETWALTETAMRVLEGFHIRHAYRMARVNIPRRNSSTGVWTYPSSADVLNEVGQEETRPLHFERSVQKYRKISIFAS